MRKARILLVLGIWALALPYLGFPYSWKDVLFGVTGLGIIFISYLFYLDYKKQNPDSEEKTFDNFSENNGFVEIEEEIEEEVPEEIVVEETEEETSA